MLDEGVEIAAYKNLVGLGLHIQTLDQIADESYEHLIVARGCPKNLNFEK